MLAVPDGIASVSGLRKAIGAILSCSFGALRQLLFDTELFRLTTNSEEVCPGLDELLRIIDEMFSVFAQQFEASIGPHLACRHYFRK